MAPLTRNPVVKLLWSLHAWILQASRGRLASSIVGLPVLLLHTVGRKTGRPHTSPLCYVPHGSDYIVIGSNGGADQHPDWVLNLRNGKQAWIELGGKRIEVKPHELAGAEAKVLYQRFADVYAGYTRYRQKTTRKIAVIALEPVQS